MKNPVVTLFILAILLLAIVSPFTVLAVPLLILFGAVALWFGWTLVQALIKPIQPDSHKSAEGQLD